MAINFPKFPNNRRDKNRPTANDISDLEQFEPMLDETDTQAHNRSHHDMLTQTEQLNATQMPHIKRQPKAKPAKNPKNSSLMPILLGILLLGAGAAAGYLYQEYTQPPPPAPPAKPVPTTPATTATVPPATTPASGAANTPAPATSPAVAPSDKVAVAPAPAPPVSAPVPTPPPAPVNNTPPPATTPAPAPTPQTNEKLMAPANKAPSDGVPSNNPNVSSNTINISNPAPANSSKSGASYEDFVKSSEKTVFIEPATAPAKK